MKERHLHRLNAAKHPNPRIKLSTLPIPKFDIGSKGAKGTTVKIDTSDFIILIKVSHRDGNVSYSLPARPSKAKGPRSFLGVIGPSSNGSPELEGSSCGGIL